MTTEVLNTATEINEAIQQSANRGRAALQTLRFVNTGNEELTTVYSLYPKFRAAVAAAITACTAEMDKDVADLITQLAAL